MTPECKSAAINRIIKDLCAKLKLVDNNVLPTNEKKKKKKKKKKTVFL